MGYRFTPFKPGARSPIRDETARIRSFEAVAVSFRPYA
jgi:hypothetical protein